MSFTYGPTRMTVTPLGPDGKPSGPPVELGVRSFTLNTNPRPSSVGRILLHLAARYGVDLVALPPEPDPEPETLADDGQALMVVPAKLAATIQQLLEQQPWVADELGARR